MLANLITVHKKISTTRSIETILCFEERLDLITSSLQLSLQLQTYDPTVLSQTCWHGDGLLHSSMSLHVTRLMSSTKPLEHVQLQQQRKMFEIIYFLAILKGNVKWFKRSISINKLCCQIFMVAKHNSLFQYLFTRMILRCWCIPGHMGCPDIHRYPYIPLQHLKNHKQTNINIATQQINNNKII